MRFRYCLLLLLASLALVTSESRETDGQASDDENCLRPVFTKEKTTHLAFVPGEKVSLNCKATGCPELSVQWTINGTLFNGTKGNTNRFVFRLRNIQKNDSGVYNCNVSNSRGWIQRTFSVTVIQRDRSPPTITEITGNRTVCEGDNVTLKCKASSDLTPYLTWVKQCAIEGERSSDNFITIPKEEISIRRGDAIYLVINNTRQSDSGQYMCIAANIFGSTNTSTWLTVLPVHDN
ncbi:hypothetical protein MTO96_005359 [Rhipicephalus appendiculatus]|uniref:receptor protein-tyrosine kinase n=1 Tax=Rhipicephalus appendiculatus TaxID=34631 RepID=A0A131YSR7_RHIAP